MMRDDLTKTSGFFLLFSWFELCRSQKSVHFYQDKVVHMKTSFFMILYQKYIILIKKFMAQPCPVKNAPTFVNDMTKISQIRNNPEFLGKITLFPGEN